MSDDDRMLDTGIDANWGTGSAITWALSPLPFLVHLTVFALCHDEPEYPFVILGATIATILTIVSIILGSNWATPRLVPSRQRRHVYSLRVSQVGGFLLVPVVVLLVLPWRKDPELLLIVYPLWIIVTGVTIFSLASSAGHLCANGTIFLLASMLMALKPSVAPVIAGILASANLASQGYKLGKLPNESAAPR